MGEPGTAGRNGMNSLMLLLPPDPTPGGAMVGDVALEGGGVVLWSMDDDEDDWICARAAASKLASM